jgi:quaternary ammonium compound-resistance protein SugE
MTRSAMAWIYLLLAGLLEIGWAIGLKYTDGFTRLWPSVATALTMAASFGLLSLALRTIPMGTAYAVWTGIGAAGTAAFGMAFLGESRDVIRLVFLLLIIGGVAGLKFAASPP